MGLFDNLFNAKKAEVTKEPQRKAREIEKKTIRQQMFRFNKQIDTWKLGINCFEDVFNSTTETIIGVYNDVVIDAHLSASMDTRVSKTTSKDFKIVDESGEEMDETELFQTQWFRDFMRFSLDSKFYGYSLIQFGDRVGDGFKMVKLVPREYVYPQKQAVRSSPQNTVDLIPFDKGQYKPWTIGVGRPEDIGLLMKAAPLVIYKKTALGSWSEFTELFGSPFRFGKTDVRDEELRDNMYDMLDNMGRNAFGVFHTDDELEYIKDNQTDAHHVFDELIERSNSELSKLILGSTMTMDDGSSRSQSEVHERTSGALEKEDATFMAEVVNKQLIPWLNTYHGFNITGKWVFDETENISKPEQFKMDIELVKNGFNVPKEYFSETYGTPIDEPLEVEETPDPKGGKSLDANNVLKKKVFSLTNYSLSIDEDNCDICNTIDLSDTPPPEWSEEFIDNIIAGVHSGLYTLTNLPESLYLDTADRLVKSMLEGVAESKVIPTIADPDFIRALRNNAYVFSGAKTFQEVKTMSDFILDANGDVRSFAEFKKKAGATFDTFNKNWLRTELTQAQNTAEAASKWQQFEAEKEIFPMLRYDTAGDERVRSSHAKLDGIIKPVGDKFWDTHAVPNGWNCRCELLQESEAIATPDEDIKAPEDIPESMQFNPGKQKVLFSPEHPYFVVDDQFSALRDNNFGLPEPPPFVVPEVEGFKAAKTIKDAEDFIKSKGLAKNVVFKRLNLEGVNTVNKTLIDLDKKYKNVKMTNLVNNNTWEKELGGKKQRSLMGFSAPKDSFVLFPKSLKKGAIRESNDYTAKTKKISPILKTLEMIKAPKRVVDLMKTRTNRTWFVGSKIKDSVTHEIGHKLHLQLGEKKLSELNILLQQEREKGYTYLLGDYAVTNNREFFAESFAAYNIDIKRKYVSPKIVEFIEKNLLK